MDSGEENKIQKGKMANESDNEKDALEEDGEEDLVPEDAFWHIEASRLNGFEADMMLEIEHGEKKFWTAKVANVFSNLMSIKWSGTGSNTWFDVKHNKCYPYGYLRLKQDDYKLEPPGSLKLDDKAIKEVIEAYGKESASQDASKPSSLYFSGGLDPCNVFKPGIILEVAHRLDPDKHWFAEVLENVGGRLHLQWFHRLDKEAVEDKDSGNPAKFWIYYSHPRVHHLGYAKEKGDISYEPTFLYNSWVTDIQRFLTSLEEEKESLILTKYMINLAQRKRPSLMEPESIKETQVSDMALTFPADTLKLVPVVVNSKSDQHLIVSSQTNNVISCYPHDDNVALLPISWAEEHGASLYNFEDAANDFRSYLAKNKCNEAPIKLFEHDKIHKFKVNHKIEVVHPQDPNKICEGIVSRITSPLVWIEISSDLVHVLPYNSTDLFPVGFCEDHSYPLTKLLSNTKKYTKRRTSNEDKETSPIVTAAEPKSIVSLPEEMLPIGSKDICPRIYFNHKCFTGPLLSKSKIRELPRFVGPGPVLLVLQEVISKIISVAYVPPRVLNEMSSKNFDELLKKNDIEDSREITFKAKYQKKSYRDGIVVINNAEDVPEYCKLVCSHLKCCYNLFGPSLYDGDDCPSHCRGLRKTNKVLRRAIYYRQKAAKAKSSQDSTKSSASPTSSATKEVESSENVEVAVTEAVSEAQEEEKETKEVTISLTKEAPSIMTKSNPNEESKSQSPVSDDKKDEEASQEGSIEKKSDGNDSSGQEEDISKAANITIFPVPAPTNIGANSQTSLKLAATSIERSLLIKSNKRKLENIQESVSSNGSNKSIGRSLPKPEIAKKTKVTLSKKAPPPVLAPPSAAADPIPDYRNDCQHPLNWSIKDVYNFVKKSSCPALAPTLLEHEIDGPALLLLDHETIRHNLILGYTRKYNADDTLKLSHLIRRLKARYFPGSTKLYKL